LFANKAGIMIGMSTLTDDVRSAIIRRWLLYIST